MLLGVSFVSFLSEGSLFHAEVFHVTRKLAALSFRVELPSAGWW